MSHLRLRCSKFDFGYGSVPNPAGGAHSKEKKKEKEETSKKGREKKYKIAVFSSKSYHQY